MSLGGCETGSASLCYFSSIALKSYGIPCRKIETFYNWPRAMLAAQPSRFQCEASQPKILPVLLHFLLASRCFHACASMDELRSNIFVFTSRKLYCYDSFSLLVTAVTIRCSL